MEVDAQLPRLAGIERPLEIRRLRPRGQRDLQLDSAFHPPKRDDLGRVRRLDLHHAAQEQVHPVDVSHEAVAARFEGRGERLAIQCMPFRRHRAHRVLDHGIGERGLQALGFRAERRAIEGGKDPAVDVGLAQLGLGRFRVALGEDLEARLVPAQAGHHEPVLTRERHVRILGKRRECGLAGHVRPAPLLVVAVVIADEEVEDARAQESARVDFDAGVGEPHRP